MGGLQRDERRVGRLGIARQHVRARDVRPSSPAGYKVETWWCGRGNTGRIPGGAPVALPGSRKLHVRKADCPGQTNVRAIPYVEKCKLSRVNILVRETPFLAAEIPTNLTDLADWVRPEDYARLEQRNRFMRAFQVYH